MIEEIKELIKSEEFKTWLSNPKLWKSLDVDYHPPRVERVWMQFNDMRLSLHVIHPCEREEALLHPHPWESAVYVLPIGGTYEHGIGVRETQLGDGMFPEMTNDIILSTQEYSGDVYYEMLNKKTVHYVRPIGLPVFTIMISGPKKWDTNGTKVDKPLTSLSEERKIEILNTFKHYFK